MIRSGPGGMSCNDLTILYLDRCLAAIHKPAGYVVHKTPLSPDAPVVLQQLRDQLGHAVYPVHRLDRATCGVLVLALSSEDAGTLCRSFREHRVIQLPPAPAPSHSHHSASPLHRGAYHHLG